jgi:hypothetical protein
MAHIHHTGSQKEDYSVSLTAFFAFCEEILREHTPMTGLPDPVIRLPKGFWITYASDNKDPRLN